jgi:molybdate-binding protein/DNA-binding XRE family transcriptional regulator
MQSEPLVILLKRRRQRARLSQQALADSAGITRQALIAIEAGRQVPSTMVALRLASALQCRVEDLFRIGEASQVCARMASPPASRCATGRMTMGRIKGEWIAHPLPASSPGAADGVLLGPSAADAPGKVLVQPLLEHEEIGRNIMVAGCAPVLGVLSERVGLRFADARVRWLGATSTRALDLLSGGLVHVAGTHLFDERTGKDNVSMVKERFGDQRMLVINLVKWQQGLILPSGNPRKIRRAADVLRRGIRVAWREEGAAARTLLVRALAAAGACKADMPRGPVLPGHMEVAQAVAIGAAHVGVAIEAAALAFGLDFIPLAAERFDLVLAAGSASTAPVARLLDAIDDGAFRREVKELGGYDASATGHVITLDAAGDGP